MADGAIDTSWKNMARTRGKTERTSSRRGKKLYSLTHILTPPSPRPRHLQEVDPHQSRHPII